MKENAITFTREDLQREYNLGEEDIKETLKSCGLSLKKCHYSEKGQKRFSQARKLFEEGTAHSYDDIVEIKSWLSDSSICQATQVITKLIQTPIDSIQYDRLPMEWTQY